MPANPKYLTTSKWQRLAKITAGFIGGFILSSSIHIAFALLFGRVNVIITSSFSAFLLWAIFFILAFLSKNGWKVWGWYILISLICCSVLLF